ncbi:kinase-like protein [Pseudovirgaria hyperparasitica]|uniref:Kinase-like protein n=1 Tax=Pseudovirgaria hyperparasitica TaxID=470096 RepID=A0A6A6WIV3_9PEZI|nr:kinase-like protein [Pseudovirgaria hyperparasitica]KAF2762026.1 kinase-like protein [Pseudovirgaria hyperparasitica]
MTVAFDPTHRVYSQGGRAPLCLEDKYEIMKEIGDGSFGSVVLGRVRSAGSHVARRGSLVAIKTMKKTFEHFNQCLELREVIFLRTLPSHVHLVPALDIFLDPYSKKLHISMEYMDGNLYQLMKARDHKPLDGSSVKSILFQIMSGLEHIHHHDFFHRDIKPENILVSTSAQSDSGSAFRRYSALVTPPSTPPSYTIKIADFGLARETHSKLPYTTYVSTRWYRAPEVLLRAGEYSAPVDVWAIGAMAVEIATLKPLFPGSNEVDQVWRVCEIMGSPGRWVNKQNVEVGGGEWKDGVKLAQKLGFSFPKMAPHSMETILSTPQWPSDLANFVTWCLMWDPARRPTSSQALGHPYFADAYDPLRPKSSASRLLGRKHSDISSTDLRSDGMKASWFRRSLVARESAPAVPQHNPITGPLSPNPSPVHVQAPESTSSATKVRPSASKRATWTNGMPNNAAPMPILPSIRPVSPLSAAVTAQANVRPGEVDEKGSKKIGRQLSVQSHNHYADHHRQEAERALNGQSRVMSPPSSHKEGFFSHLRKRARRFSGRYQTPMSPNSDDIEASAGCAPWGNLSNRQSMVVETSQAVNNVQPQQNDLSELDKALQSVRYSLDVAAQANAAALPKAVSNPMLKRHHSVPHQQPAIGGPPPVANGSAPVSSRTRRALKHPGPTHRYETPDEEEELLDEALTSAHKAASRLDRHSHQKPGTHEPTRPAMSHTMSEQGPAASYMTPSHSANRNEVSFGHDCCTTPTKPMTIHNHKTPPQNHETVSKWPTPPYDENDWAATASASIFAAGSHYR